MRETRDNWRQKKFAAKYIRRLGRLGIDAMTLVPEWDENPPTAKQTAEATRDSAEASSLMVESVN